MEKIREGNMGIVELADFQQDVEKRLAHQEGECAHPLDVIHPEQDFPVRVFTEHQLPQRLDLRFAEMKLIPFGGMETQRVVQKNLPYLEDIIRQLILEFSPILRFGADGPQDILVLRVGGYQGVHPTGNAAAHIGVASLQNHTDAHGYSSSIRMTT